MAARFKVNGTNNATAPTISPDSGSGYRITGDTSIKYSTAQYYEGTASLTGNGYNAFFDNGSGTAIYDTSAIYVDLFCRIPSAPGSDTYLCGGQYYDVSGVYITTDRRIAFKDASGTVRGQSSANLVPTASWFRIRVRYDTTNGADAAWLWTSSFTDDDPTNAGATLVSATASMSSGLVSFGTATSGWYFDDIVIAPTSEGNTTHAGATTHTASATRATTATLTAAAAKDAVVGATRATTATTAAAAALERVGEATSSVTATLSAAATVEQFVDGSLSVTATTSATPEGEVAGSAALAVTATLSAVADVSTPGVVTMAATLPVAATPTATADRVADIAATRPITATLAAAADVVTPSLVDIAAVLAVTTTPTAAGALSTSASATLAVTSTLTVAGFLEEESTRGLMAGVTRATATMTPITGAGNVPRRVSLLSIDTATMTALVSMTQVPGLAGVPVFIGGDESPLLAGLVAAGTAYLWISDGVVYYEDGS